MIITKKLLPLCGASSLQTKSKCLENSPKSYLQNSGEVALCALPHTFHQFNKVKFPPKKSAPTIRNCFNKGKTFQPQQVVLPQISASHLASGDNIIFSDWFEKPVSFQGRSASNTQALFAKSYFSTFEQLICKTFSSGDYFVDHQSLPSSVVGHPSGNINHVVDCLKAHQHICILGDMALQTILKCLKVIL